MIIIVLIVVFGAGDRKGRPYAMAYIVLIVVFGAGDRKGRPYAMTNIGHRCRR